MTEQKKKKVLYTEDYSKFKFNFANRNISKAHINEIKSKITNRGWICSPILVNENYEIIDGQHRFEALKQLGMPIEYLVAEGLTIEDARELNSASKNWTTQNYIDSYAADGNINYINFSLLEKKYPQIPMTSIYGVVVGRIITGGGNTLKSGTLRCPTEKLTDYYKVLDFVTDHIGAIKRIEGRFATLVTCFGWVIANTDADLGRLGKVVRKEVFPPVSDSAPARFLESLSKAYNKGLAKAKQIKFYALYELQK